MRKFDPVLFQVADASFLSIPKLEGYRREQLHRFERHCSANSFTSPPAFSIQLQSFPTIGSGAAPESQHEESGRRTHQGVLNECHRLRGTRHGSAGCSRTIIRPSPLQL
jgi:hypothetical protein